VVVTAELFRRLRAGGPPLPGDLDGEGALAALERASAALASAPLPEGFAAALDAELGALAPGPGARFSVRSSADVEDRAGALGAGLYASRVDVAPDGVAGALRAVLASALAPAVVAYRARAGLPAGDVEMAALVHPFTDGDASGTAAYDPAAEAAPRIEVSAGRAQALRPAARAAIEAAARALAAAHGPVEIEWVSEGDGVRFLQLRPYRAPRARRFGGAAELAALPGGPWRWDAAHNPLPLSPAQAGLVAFADARCRTAFRQRVVRGYLFWAPAAPPPPATAAGTAGERLRALAADPAARLGGRRGGPRPTLEQTLDTFERAYEPLFGEIQPAAAAARAALADLLRAHGLGAEALPALLAGVPSLASERAARAAAIAAAPDGGARAAAVAAYLDLFGDEAPVWDVAAPTYAEDPSAVGRLAGAATARAARTVDAAAATAARIRASLPEPARAEWDARLAAAQEAAAVAEDDDALYARVQAGVRRALLDEGERLRGKGELARADDVFWLPLEAVRRHARGEAPALGAAEAARAVAEARRAYDDALADPPPLAPSADGALAEPGAGLARGLAAAPGRAVGAVHLHPAAAGAQPPSASSVIVARTLLPTELPLLPAAALVVETGGLLDHVAAQARERGIPAVVAAPGACAAFTDGDRVLVDGDAGVVVRLGAGGPGSGPKRRATYEDLLRVPDHLVAEIIEGELVTSPRPAVRHAAAASSIHAGLSGPFDRRGGGSPGGWVLLFEPELHVVEQVMVPDIAGWRQERLPVLPDTPFIELPPDWICEVLSPSTIALDRTRKVHLYARAGVRHLWLVDPAPETLEVYRLEADGWRLVTSVAGNVTVAPEPFEAVNVDLSKVWAR
jgi:phosphohistidine swiveling domain-containing protein